MAGAYERGRGRRRRTVRDRREAWAEMKSAFWVTDWQFQGHHATVRVSVGVGEGFQTFPSNNICKLKIYHVKQDSLSRSRVTI